MKTNKIILVLLLMLSSITPSFAVEKKIYTKTLSNNLIIEYTLEETRTSKASYTVEGKKTANIKNGSTILWSVTVTGTFTYDGYHSTCTKAEVSTTCPSSYWRITSSSSSKSGASATARATGTRYNNGVAIESHTEAVTLVCGSDGTLY